MRLAILRWLLGTRLGLRVLFTGMARRFDPRRAAGFAGELQFDLLTGPDEVRSWALEVRGGRARARPGPARDPQLTIKAELDDFLRIVTRELDPMRALLGGKLDIEGDFGLMTRLGAMFGA